MWQKSTKTIAFKSQNNIDWKILFNSIFQRTVNFESIYSDTSTVYYAYSILVHEWVQAIRLSYLFTGNSHRICINVFWMKQTHQSYLLGTDLSNELSTDIGNSWAQICDYHVTKPIIPELGQPDPHFKWFYGWRLQFVFFFSVTIFLNDRIIIFSCHEPLHINKYFWMSYRWLLLLFEFLVFLTQTSFIKKN